MKIKRVKNAQKILSFYKTHFGIEAPYKILVDGTFCKAALTFRINIAEQLPKYVEAEVQLLTTTCAMAECEALGSVLYGPLKVLRQYNVAKCGHQTPVPAAQCLRAMVRKKNKRKHILATQDQDLTDMCRSKCGVPLIYIAHNTISLEPPSDQSREKASEELKSQLGPTDYEHKVLAKLKKEEFGDEVKKKKRKKLKGPNPLSCKPKSKKGLNTPLKEKKKRRKKKNVKLPEHIKEHLKQQFVES